MTSGPYETERDISAEPAVRAIYDAMHELIGTITPEQRLHIDAMCSALILDPSERAGVTLGAYDRRIVHWLGGWEAETCQVIGALITRAYEAGQRSVAEPVQVLAEKWGRNSTNSYDASALYADELRRVLEEKLPGEGGGRDGT